jgi:release factor glutamine methyltransferase
VKRRGQGEPIAYILGHREFWGLKLAVSTAVLVPRPETELLVELALRLLPDDVEGTVVDVGTGSGCVALALLSAREGLRAIATDVSPAALEIARQNADAVGVLDRLDLRAGDLLTPCGDVRGARLVVSNPPYIRQGDAALAPDVLAWEPALALFGEGEDALGHHRRIVADAPAVLADDGAVLLEIGADQGAAARALAGPPFVRADIERDLAGLDRVVVLRR